MNYHGISKDDVNNGEGIRVVLWVSGCSHNCKGCHNPSTHSITSGELFTEEDKLRLFSMLNKKYIKGITISGGDPMHEANRDEILSLCKEIKSIMPSKDIWLYTGYKIEYLKSRFPDILATIDVLVDGQFVESLKDRGLEYRGSSNQRIIRLKNEKKR